MDTADRDRNASTNERDLLSSLRRFAQSVTDNFAGLAAGEPEAQLTVPVANLLSDAGNCLGLTVQAKRESQLPNRLGRPDYAVLSANLLAGYVELKEPGKGVAPSNFRGHDRKQFDRFKALPNLIYSDGNQWALYRDGERIGRIVRFTGVITEDGSDAITEGDAEVFKALLTDFLSWEPIVPTEARALAELLAPICRMLRNEVTDALANEESPLRHLYADWQRLLFPDADHDQFADAYAQTVTFALLLARSEGADTTDEALNDPIQQLAADHALLSRALQVLTDRNVRDEISPPLRLLQRVIGRVPQDALASSGEGDPWLYFYEDFLAAYDSSLRKDAGAYYTPVEVVRAQVRLIDRLLVDKLDRPEGFCDSNVITLDPAVGTGTYLLGVIDHATTRVADEQGEGAVAGKVTALGERLFGFEIMVGPYAVAQLRVSRALMDHGANLPEDGPGVFLTDTLESPHAEPPEAIMGFAQRELAEQHERAQVVKDEQPVIVCLGNPPYDRHEAVARDNVSRTGAWVRFGDDLEEREKRGLTWDQIRERRESRSILYRNFVQPTLDAGHGGDVKNLYNLYVYFWRWALWKVFEHTSSTGPGVVSFISAASYCDGDAFVGVREHMRRVCDEVWIIDLGGEGRGTRKTENVFNIQTSVAIAVAVCYGESDHDRPARVHYTRIDGSREEKLARLDGFSSFADLAWIDCPDAWHAPFRPAGVGHYFKWPQLIDLMPWQISGVQAKRTWPIAPDEDTLRRRWRALLRADDRATAFNETRDRKITRQYLPLLGSQQTRRPIVELATASPPPEIRWYAYRSFDRQLIFCDNRVGDYMRSALWGALGDRQVYLTTLLNHPLGNGPAVTVAAEVPDLHHFRGSYGAREIIPLYRDSAAQEANIPPNLLGMLGDTYECSVSAKDFLAYVYGVLGQPEFTERFHDELATRELRVPLTKDAELFERVAEIGRYLLWLHTYGERFSSRERRRGHVPRGSARCTQRVQGPNDPYPDDFDYDPDTKQLAVGQGVFEPVEPEVYDFEVSGLKVVRSWLGYRMASGRGRKSSPLDDIRPQRWTDQFTTELLQLLWVLEKTIETYPQQAELLDQVLDGELFQADGLPDVPPEMRKAPSAREASLFESESD